MLLYSSIASEIDETVVIQGHAIRFATVNLNAEMAEIRERLLEVASTKMPVFGREAACNVGLS